MIQVFNTQCTFIIFFFTWEVIDKVSKGKPSLIFYDNHDVAHHYLASFMMANAKNH